MDLALIKAYEETDYRVDDDPPLILRIGERNDGARVLMASFNVETAAFVTAWNPRSKRLTPDENYDRHQQMLNEIEQLRLNYFVGESEHPENGWREDSFLVLGIARQDATRLASQFEQNGYVWITMSGVPELVVVVE